jgi:PTS system fructose-specific IIC component
MTRLYAIVEAGETGVSGVLAGEALRRAAKRRDQPLEIELRSAQGVINPVTPAADEALLSSRPKAPAILPSRRAHHRLTIEAVLADPDAALASALSAPVEDKAVPRIVAVTSCPTGIAHTFMAAEGLQGARQLGYALKVETQGSVGAGNPLTAEEIAQADVVLIAADREVDRVASRASASSPPTPSPRSPAAPR